MIESRFIRENLITITEDGDIPITSSIILCNGVGLNVSLPSAVGITKKLIIKNIGSSVNISAVLTQTIDGSTTKTLSEVNECINIVSDGANWRIIDPASKSNEYPCTAGETLGAQRVVYVVNDEVFYADNTVQDHKTKILGITKTAAVENDPIVVITAGEYEEVSWSWDTSKVIYLSSAGFMTQTVPTDGFAYVIAIPITPTKIFIEKKLIEITQTLSETSKLMSPNTNYISDHTSKVSFTLPAYSSIGDVIRIVGKGVGGWEILQSSTQQIMLGHSATSYGDTGKVASYHYSDSIELVCITTNTIWRVTSVMGNITIV